MMRNKVVLFTIVALFVLLIVSELNKPKPVNWDFVLTSYSKDPFGCKVLYNLLDHVFPDEVISKVSVTLYEQIFLSPPDDISVLENANPSNYIIISETFTPDDLDLTQLLNYVDKGSNVFIAAIDFGQKLEDTLQFKLSYNYAFNDTLIGLNFTDPSLKAAKDYQFSTHYKGGNYFEDFNLDSVVVLGTNGNQDANLLNIKFGKGNFYLSSVPIAFTNYYLVNGINHRYAETALSYLPVAKVYWDEYYKPNNEGFGRKGESPLRYILSVEALRWALYLGIATMLVFIFFQAKRRQRIIPVIKPLPNTTLEFTKTVGRLYYQHGDHKDLAKKKITYFMAFLRAKLYLKEVSFNKVTYEHIASKTGISLEDIYRLFNSIQDIENRTAISSDELLVLSRNIDRFYKQLEL
jgi:hypothetical protein